MKDRYFPFSAVVGQEQLKLALLISLVAPEVGGLLISGTKGSAKTTLVRSLRYLLGDPSKFVELPMGVTEDRVKGSLDISVALRDGEIKVKDGLLAKADGGVLYVDEVNLLPDHIVDLILDASATGINVVERDGVSITQPARFVLIGTMNPEEGELRPQLLDRFGLSVSVLDDLSFKERFEAVTRRLAFDANDSSVIAPYLEEDQRLKEEIERARITLTEQGLTMFITDEVVSEAIEISMQEMSEGLRGDLTLLRAAVALCVLRLENSVKRSHLLEVAPLVFAHRSRAQRSHQQNDQEGKGSKTYRAQNSEPNTNNNDKTGQQDNKDSNRARVRGDSGTDKGPNDSVSQNQEIGRDPQSDEAKGNLEEPGGGQSLEMAVTLFDPKLSISDSSSPLSEVYRRLGGEGRASHRYEEGSSINLAASILNLVKEADDASSRSQLEENDLVYRTREKVLSSTVIFVVDISKSMGADLRVALAKEVSFKLLSSAYVKRLKVALITFAGERAHVALRPTKSLEVVRSRLEALSYVGRTPLDSAIRESVKMAEMEKKKGVRPLLVFISDGRANATDSNLSPFEAAKIEAKEVQRRSIETIFCAISSERSSTTYAKEIALEMGATYFELSERT
ncbi:magnesium chelatase subunit D [Ferrithrix thermotolerans DSM 19514]|uniref:Magnesium chelatase subunit D n=1 Tax=Ferrithrix thermotolerans DSM 19514 TaxID=1121881 RepID=A0A1M4VL63_9ACTN|nr:AAA family ATPase [Ferrithrix thermotolerans]SHE69625.1 magnesium chelatase subunit D [Ferrithrix thermotolerans DSM 19514]